VMKNKTRGESDETRTKGETKRKKRTRILGRARERERVGKENQAREGGGRNGREEAIRKARIPSDNFQIPLQSLYSSLFVNKTYEGEEIFVLRSMRIIYFFS